MDTFNHSDNDPDERSLRHGKYVQDFNFTLFRSEHVKQLGVLVNSNP